MSTETENTKENTIPVVKPEDKILDMNKVVFGSTGEPEDILLLSREKIEAMAEKMALIVQDEWEKPEDEFNVVKVVKDMLSNSSADELLFFAMRGVYDGIDHAVDKLREREMLKGMFLEVDAKDVVGILRKIADE